MKSLTIVSCCVALISITSANAAQQHPYRAPAKSLAGFSQEVRDLTIQVSPSVVKVEVRAFAPFEEDNGDTSNWIGRLRASASGVIVDPNGLILTNAHVVQTAMKVMVALPRSVGGGTSNETPPRRMVKAEIVGVDRESDLALLKIQADHLPALPFASPGVLRQGDLVLAIGSPMGLRNSASLGIVSATSQAVEKTGSMTYIQTDASINPGNSGGALVDMEGHLAGISTFILSKSGGNEGLGFAIPIETVRDVYRQLKTNGHVERGDIGLYLQEITPALAAGLSLSRQAGVVVADMDPDGPAYAGGFQPADIILALDGVPIESVAHCENAIRHRLAGERIKMRILRSSETLEITIEVRTQSDPFDFVSELSAPEKNLVRRLGLLCVEIDKRVASFFPELRRQYGVIVAAKLPDGQNHFVGLQQGDVIHAINSLPVVSVDLFRSTVDGFKAGDPVALQIERDGRLQYLAFELEE